MLLNTTFSTQFFIPIIILLGLSSVFSLLITVFKLKFLPAFAIEILIGVVISHWFNGFMEDIEMVSFVEGLYTTGLVMIMFLSGYDVDFELNGNFETGKLRHINLIKTTILILVLIYAGSFASSVFYLNYFSNKLLGIIILGLIFASSFAGMIVPILHDGGLSHTVIGKLLSAIANFSEALSIIFLTILMIILKVDRQYAFILLLIGLILLIFRVLKKFKVGRFFENITEGIDHLPTRLIFVLLLTMVFLSDLSGGEYILGAFVTGIFVRYSGFTDKIMTSITRIIYGVFAPMFFILVGTRIDILEFFADPKWLLVVLFIFVTMLLVKLPVLYLLKCYKITTVVPSMILLSCTIVVSIAASHIGENLNIFSREFGDSIILASILICVIGTILFKVRFPFGEYNQKTKNELEGSKDDACIL
ncbi:MAG: cation:proton antiporter [Bacilli bacterium]